MSTFVLAPETLHDDVAPTTYACPSCGSTDLEVEAFAWLPLDQRSATPVARLLPDAPVEWARGTNFMRCRACGDRDHGAAFDVAEQPSAAPAG